MKVHLRFDSTNSVHSRFTIFVNGKNSGNLCMSPDEADWFYLSLEKGCKELSIPNATPIEFVGSGTHRPNELIPPVPLSLSSLPPEEKKKKYSIRNHLDWEVGQVETEYDPIAAYACLVQASSAMLRDAGYNAVEILVSPDSKKDKSSMAKLWEEEIK